MNTVRTANPIPSTLAALPQAQWPITQTLLALLDRLLPVATGSREAPRHAGSAPVQTANA